MVFAFANSGAAAASSEVLGAELPELLQENVGFRALKGENKVRLFPAPWPSDSLPPPTSSLLSVASRRGLLAAAGPETLIIATTQSVRSTIQTEGPPTIKPLSPQLTIQLPRLSQVSFSSDENFLVVSAQNGGGLRAYAVEELAKGNTGSALEISTEGIAVRALVPNPSPDSGHLFAVLLADGKLMLADLRSRSFIRGANGPILKDGISCVAWSTKGKQLVAGTQDGTAFQLKPEPFGDIAGQIPRPPQMGSDHHVSTIFWLANDDFLIIYTPTNFESGINPDPLYYHVQREKGKQNYTFHKFTSDPAGPFGLPRSPPHHFIQRLKDFSPHLDDLLIIASTASPDIGMITRASEPLSKDNPFTTVYTTTKPPEDRQAALPTTSDEDKMMEAPDTSPIGVALDLSSTEKILRPIPAELEYQESPTPLPALMVLNNEGVLASWWILYNDSIRAGTGYSGLVALASGQSNATPAQTHSTQASPFASAASKTQSSPFSAFAKPATLSFGSPTPAGSGAAFGGPSALGGNNSPWTSQSTGINAPQTGGASFGRPAFAQSTGLGGGGGSAFGAIGGLGRGGSVWGTPSTGNQQSPAALTQSPFGKFADSKTASPFGGFANAGGFASLAQQNKSGQSALGSGSPFGSTPGTSFGNKTEPSFGSTITIDSNAGDSNMGSSKFSPWVSPSATNTHGKQQTPTFGSAQQSFASTTQESEMSGVDDDRGRSEATPTPQVKPQDKSGGLFGLGTGGFKLSSSFKGDGTAKDDLPKPDSTSSTFLGDSFSKALEEKSEMPATPIKQEPGTENETGLKDISTTPATLPKAPASSVFAAEPSSGQSSQQGSTTQAVKTSLPSGPAPEAAPLPPDFINAKKTPKEEPAPLPPDFLGSTEKLQKEEPAPLPPDFVRASKPKDNDQDDLPPLAGSPAVAVELPSSDIIEHQDASVLPQTEVQVPEVEEPDEAGQEGEDEEDEEEDISEGDEAEEEPQQPPPSDLSRRPQTKSGWSFPGSIGQQAPPFAPSPPTRTDYISRSPSNSPSRFPSQINAVPSTTPAGMPKIPAFAPPIRDSPRSPSPVRSISQPIFGRHPPAHAAKLPSRPSSRLQAPPITAEPEPSVADLEDEEDAHIRAELAAPLSATKKLDQFIPRVDYNGAVSKQGIPGQIEKVYRDINSMIDTLGLNSRALSAFIKGHNELLPDAGRSRHDLDAIAFDEDFEDWCLVEIQDLEVIEREMEQSLEAGRISNVAEKLTELAALSSVISRLRSRVSALRRQVQLSTDKDKAALRDTAPLTSEQSYQQRNIRTVFAELQKSLRQAEDAIVLLRSKLTSARPSSATGFQSAPTFEAITNTILKMTSMVERKSGDLDVLENQIKKLRMDPDETEIIESVEHDEDDLEPISSPSRYIPGAWRELDKADSSPFATPPSHKARSESVLSEATNSQGNFFTPRSAYVGTEANGSPVSRRSAQPNGMSPTRSRRAGTPGTSRREQLEREREERMGVTDELVKERMEKILRRRVVAERLETLLESRDAKITTVETR